MTLDLVKVAEQLPGLVERARFERERAISSTARALQLLHEAAKDPDAFARRLTEAHCSWTLALPASEPLDAAISPPAAPPSYAALAVDGSSIDVDRHLPVDCYLVNLGWIRVQYGAEPCFHGDTRVELQPVGEELLVRDADDPSRESAIAGAVLDVVRSVWELSLLAEQAERFATPDRPLLALLDGNLALWNLDKPGLPTSIMDELKERSVAALDRLKALVAAGSVVFSGFVSGTGAANLAHSLRLLECPLEQVVCRACPGKATATRPCDEAGAPNDGEIFKLLLGRWQRSAVFLPYRAFNTVATAETWYAGAGHDIAFFYLNVGGEIARIELPRWMADDRDRLAMLHALLVAQAGEGGLYPLVLQEAHEQAVISTGDRACFAALLERESELKQIPWLVSAKAMSKRVRAI